MSVCRIFGAWIGGWILVGGAIVDRPSDVSFMECTKRTMDGALLGGLYGSAAPSLFIMSGFDKVIMEYKRVVSKLKS